MNKEPLEKTGTKILNFFKSLPYLLFDTFFWLLFSFGIILFNIFIIMGMKEQTFTKVLYRLDITYSVITTTICFLVSIIYMMYLNEGKKRVYLFAFSLVFAFIASALSIILTIQIEMAKPFFNNKYIINGMFFTFGFSIILALVSKFDETTARDRIYGKKSRKMEEVKLQNGNFKL